MSPSRRREALYVAFATLLGLYLAFIQYLPPFRTYHLVGDIEGYHAPLFNYAFQSLKEGRFPLWDPSIYCGISFAANIQAQLFYPFTWVLFAAQWLRPCVTFMSLQIFTIAHIWLMLQFAYWWLRAGRAMPAAASLVGATVFCFSGYVINDIQHIGVICAIAWLPLAFWGVDRRRMWMIATAFALMFLAGYPATWIAGALAVFIYALTTAPAFTLRATVAILFSLLLSAVQLIPTAELASLRPHEPVYGNGPNLEWQLRRFYPSSLHDQHMYLYFGAGLLLAFLLALSQPRRFRAYAPALALAVAGVAFFQDPFHIVSTWAKHIPAFLDVVQHWNFNIVLSAAAGLFAAIAWTPLAQSRAKFVFALLPLLWFEQYWFGMRRDEHFRERGNVDRFFKDDVRMGGKTIVGMSPAMFARLRENPAYRIVTDHGPHPTEMRIYRLANPQGFDPFLTTRYRKEVEQFGEFYNNREFELPPSNEAMLQAFGVRYYVSAEGRTYYNDLLRSPHFKRIDPDDAYFKVFEYIHAKPSYRFAGGDVAVRKWTPEIREFQVTAREGGDFVLREQLLPGWSATVDGRSVPIDYFSQAFQQIRIAEGNHTISFQYGARSIWLAFCITLGSAGALIVLVLKKL